MERVFGHGRTPSLHRPPPRRKETALMETATLEKPAAANENTKIKIKDLSFYYGASKSLKNVSVPLHDRKVTASGSRAKLAHADRRNQ